MVYFTHYAHYLHLAMQDTATVALPLLTHTNVWTSPTCKEGISINIIDMNDIDTLDSKRVFILGPSHHVYLESCALSQCDSYETPLGDLVLDKEGMGHSTWYCVWERERAKVGSHVYLHLVIQELAGTGHFSQMSKSVDEDEHSIEMHLPYTAKIFEG